MAQRDSAKRPRDRPKFHQIPADPGLSRLCHLILHVTAGAAAQISTAIPDVPLITSIVSGRQATDQASQDNPSPVVVIVQAAAGEIQPLDHFDVRHRLAGTEAWTQNSAAVVLLAGYVKGDAVEIQARTVSSAGTPSWWTGTSAHTVAATDPAPPSPPQSVTVSSPAAGSIRVSVTASASGKNAATQIYYASGATALFAKALKVGDPISSGPNVALPPFDITGLAVGATYRVWATALDADAPPNESAPAGPASITVN